MRQVLVCLALSLLAACSGGGGTTTSASPVSPSNPISSAPAAELSLFAGSAGGAGNVDGVGTLARFDKPMAIARDSDGNFYVADSMNHTIRKISSAGQVSTLAGSAGEPGYVDGRGADARFYHPTGLAVDRVGNVYVADDLNDVIRKITPSGQVSTLAGMAGNPGRKDGLGTAAQLSLCDQDDIGCGTTGIAVDSAGNVYFTETSYAIRKITAAGMVTTLALTQCAYPLANGSDAKCFDRLAGLVIDNQDRIFVADGSRIRLLSSSGEFAPFAGSKDTGDNDGQGVKARFSYISGLGVAEDRLIVLEAQRVRTIAADGQVSTIGGPFMQQGYVDGNEHDARFGIVTAASGDSSGNVYVVDLGNHAIRKISATRSVSTFAGLGHYRARANYFDGTVNFSTPAGIVTDTSGNVYVNDFGAGVVQKITPVGQASLFANNTSMAGTAFPSPQGLTINNDGVLYLTDTTWGNIVKIQPNGTVSTLALTFADNAHSGGLLSPRGITAAADGSLYVAETGTNLIRKVSAGGLVSTVAVDTATVKLNFPNGMAIDRSGNLFIADSYSHAIRKINTNGVASTFAGSPGLAGSIDGNGTQARFYVPQSLAFDAKGNLYVADTYNNTIRKITPAGDVSTIAGIAGQRGFIEGALPGRLPHPYALAVHGDSLYITVDAGVAVIRKLP